jgi:hypothetical protein
MSIRTDAIIRFGRQVDITDDGCWLWTGVKGSGYGLFFDGKSKHKHVRAHRWSYEYFIGPIPKGLQVDHLCRNRSCVCPEHLEPVTRAENMRRLRLHNMRATHCANGHRYTDTTTRMDTSAHGNPLRRCRVCERNARRRRYRRYQEAAGIRTRPLTHCKRGHEFTPDNTKVSKEGWKTCRTCRKQLQRDRALLRRAATSPSRRAEASLSDGR